MTTAPYRRDPRTISLAEAYAQVQAEEARRDPAAEEAARIIDEYTAERRAAREAARDDQPR